MVPIPGLWEEVVLFADVPAQGGGLDVCGASGDDGRWRSAGRRGCAGVLGGAPGRPQGWDARPGVLAVRVLRAGLDRGLAGPGDVAGASAAAGGDADRRTRRD